MSVVRELEEQQRRLLAELEASDSEVEDDGCPLKALPSPPLAKSLPSPSPPEALLSPPPAKAPRLDVPSPLQAPKASPPSSDADDVDELLEAPVDGARQAPAAALPPLRERLVLKRRLEEAEALPEGWVATTHDSGLPVYLHKASRVATFARPFSVGPGALRSHRPPPSALPCFRELRLQQGDKDACPAMAEETLSVEELKAYSVKRFDFASVPVLRPQSKEEARELHRRRKFLKAGLGSLESTAEQPSLPGLQQTFYLQSEDKSRKPVRLNAARKTSVQVLHEFAQKAFRTSADYVFEETRSTETPYSATAKLSGEPALILAKQLGLKAEMVDDHPVLALGSGLAASKKAAKLVAAAAALKLIVPGLKLDRDAPAEAEASATDTLALFDATPVDDVRVPELSYKTGQPGPHLLLRECLKRHATLTAEQLESRMERLGHMEHRLTLTLGKLSATVECAAKAEGKQRAAQDLLRQLHPEARVWGQLLRLYGPASQRGQREAKAELSAIVRLQEPRKADTADLGPNTALLDKLKDHMRRLAAKPPAQPLPRPVSGLTKTQ